VLVVELMVLVDGLIVVVLTVDWEPLDGVVVLKDVLV
jgi:hypothetical protein